MDTGLLSMPLEILQHIVHELCPHCQGEQSTQGLLVHYPNTRNDERWRSAFLNYASLSGLCQASRFLRTVALPVLYHRVKVKSWPRDEFFPLTRFLYQHPEFAVEVKELHIADVEEITRPTHFSRQDMDFIKSACFNVGYSVPELDGMDILYEGDGGMDSLLWDRMKMQNKTVRPILVDLLLSQTTAIEHLRIEATEHEPLRWQSPDSTIFPALQGLELDCMGNFSEDTEYPNASEFLKRLTSPSYVKIQFCTFFPSDPRLSSVRFLHLLDSHLSYQDLQSIVKACPSLESFRHSPRPFHGNDYSNKHGFTGRELCRAFLPLKNTLVNLDVDLWYSGQPSRHEMMDDLTEYGALELVCLHVNCLDPYYEGRDSLSAKNLLVDLLPKSVKSVSIDGVHFDFMPPMVHLAEMACAGLFPNLKYLYYVGHVPTDSSADLRAICQRAGVKSRQGWLRGCSI